MDVHSGSSSGVPGRTRVDPPPVQATTPAPPAHPDGEPISHGARREQGSTRHDLLIALRRHGPASPDNLAHLLGISRTAVLQQLRALAASGLVERQAVRHGVGRPRHLYDVTPDARTHFPANYDSLAASILQAAHAAGGVGLVDRILDERRCALAASVRARFEDRALGEAPLRERVRELAVIQDEQGYLCELLAGGEAAGLSPSATAAERTAGTQPAPPVAIADPPRQTDDAGVAGAAGDDELRLREHNCPIYRVAEAMPRVCEAELQLFAQVLGARVVRETHIMSGGRSCTYRIAEVATQASVG